MLVTRLEFPSFFWWRSPLGDGVIKLWRQLNLLVIVKASVWVCLPQKPLLTFSRSSPFSFGEETHVCGPRESLLTCLWWMEFYNNNNNNNNNLFGFFFVCFSFVRPFLCLCFSNLIQWKCGVAQMFPLFLAAEPQIRFAQADKAQFALRKIVADDTKFF